MISMRKKIEFGDFQTPKPLAETILSFLVSLKIRPEVVIEPTCGLGAFVRASQRAFPTSKVFAFDINEKYIRELRSHYGQNGNRLHAAVQDFFEKDWKSFFQKIEGDILVIGNPPWVTNSSLGMVGGQNLPPKSNFQNHKGFAAKTGKANFDISEWMLIKTLETLGKHRACLAMLCKTATARKVLKHAWLNHFPIGRATIHSFDAQEHFNVSVDACLLIVHTGIMELSSVATVYGDISFNKKISTIGLYGKELVANVDEFHRLRDLDGLSYYTWRSGVKHDAARVMEFTSTGSSFRNGSGESISLEPTHLYPLLKSSDIANGKLRPSRFVLLTQRRPSDDTTHIQSSAPLTWRYLCAHAKALERRQSIIYQKRPRFSVFGVGDYTFAPWKVAISGFYKTLKFQVIGEYTKKPIVVDDTCYFIPCQTKREAQFVCNLLNSDLCQRFLCSLVFLDAKRPITIDVLSRIDLGRLAERLGVDAEARTLLVDAQRYEHEQPILVYEKKKKKEEYRTMRSTQTTTQRQAGRR